MRIAQPEFDAALGRIRECEMGRVRAPASEAELGIGRKVDFDLRAFGNLAQRKRAVENRVVQSVGLGIDSHTGDAQHGLRQFSNGRIADGLTLHREMASRADSQRGREG